MFSVVPIRNTRRRSMSKADCFVFTSTPLRTTTLQILIGVQHFWRCSRCLNTYTLEYQSKHGVVLRNLLGISTNLETIRFVAAA